MLSYFIQKPVRAFEHVNLTTASFCNPPGTFIMCANCTVLNMTLSALVFICLQWSKIMVLKTLPSHYIDLCYKAITISKINYLYCGKTNVQLVLRRRKINEVTKNRSCSYNISLVFRHPVNEVCLF